MDRSRQDEARAVKNRFREKYAGHTGTLEDGDGQNIIINLIAHSFFCSEYRNDQYGVPHDESALCVDWIPASDLAYTHVDDEPVVFPKTFEGINVYYHKDGPIVAR